MREVRRLILTWNSRAFWGNILYLLLNERITMRPYLYLSILFCYFFAVRCIVCNMFSLLYVHLSENIILNHMKLYCEGNRISLHDDIYFKNRIREFAAFYNDI